MDDQRSQRRARKERARSSPRLRELLLSPEALRHWQDRLAAAESPETEEEPMGASPSGLQLDISDLQALPEFDRLVILGVFWGGMSNRTISKLTNVSEPTIRRSLETSRATLRNRIGG